MSRENDERVVSMGSKQVKRQRRLVKKNVMIFFGDTLELMKRQPLKVRWGLCKRILFQK